MAKQKEKAKLTKKQQSEQAKADFIKKKEAYLKAKETYKETLKP